MKIKSLGLKFLLLILFLLLLLTSCKSKNQFDKNSSVSTLEEPKTIDSFVDFFDKNSSVSNFEELKTIYSVIDLDWDFDKFVEDMNLENGIYFNRYHNFSSRHISVKRGEVATNDVRITISGDIENLIISTSSLSIEQIKKNFGEAQFENSDINLYGYKFSDVYIFFVGKNTAYKISVYKNNMDYNAETIEKVIKSLIENHSSETISKPLRILDNEWQDGDNRKYDGGLKYTERRIKRERAYFSRGIEFSFQNQDNPTGILNIYSNFSDYDNLKNKYSNNELINFIDEDFIFIFEKDRIIAGEELTDYLSTSATVSPNLKFSILKNYDGDECGLWGLFLIDLENQQNNKETNIAHVLDSDIFWIKDRYFIYQPFLCGIYIYDISLDTHTEIYPAVKKNGEIDIISVDKGKVKLEVDYYDEKQVDETVVIEYSFDNDDGINFN